MLDTRRGWFGASIPVQKLFQGYSRKRRELKQHEEWEGRWKLPGCNSSWSGVGVESDETSREHGGGGRCGLKRGGGQLGSDIDLVVNSRVPVGLVATFAKERPGIHTIHYRQLSRHSHKPHYTFLLSYLCTNLTGDPSRWRRLQHCFSG